MKGKDLIQVVSEILRENVTEEQAKDFALKHFGQLSAFIRGELIDKMAKEKKELEASKEKRIYRTKQRLDELLKKRFSDVNRRF